MVCNFLYNIVENCDTLQSYFRIIILFLLQEGKNYFLSFSIPSKISSIKVQLSIFYIFAKKRTFLMEKIKLAEARKNKGYSQGFVAEKLCLNESNYCRREKGHIKISIEEWRKLAELFGVQIEDIFEPEENSVYIYNEHSSSIYQNNNNSTIYSIPEFMLEALQKQIKQIEEENKTLKERLKKYEKS